MTRVACGFTPALLSKILGPVAMTATFSRTVVVSFVVSPVGLPV